ncbi:MAG: hypothetical protein HY288_16825, partial [Planctomycetia bacterium]|nr:hypothetical protein [Planctomycetia bacterium]
AALAREDYEVTGEADLARLAAMLPATLRIRQGTEITSGQAALVISSRPQSSGTTWTGHIDASRLAATADGRALTWENPLAIQFTMHQTSTGLVVDRAQCTSSFLQIDAAGSLDDLTASAKFDLAKLMSELRQFSDLNNLNLTGSGQAQLAWKRGADDQFAAQADFQARNFQLVASQGRPWKEDSLVARLELGGQLVGQTLKRVERAQFAIEAGGERLQAKLAEPISDPASAVWPLECAWRGSLANWPPRLEACTALTGWELSGAGSAQATLNYSSKGIEIDHLQANSKPFQTWGNGWFINEPSLSLALEGHWDFAKSRLDVAQGKLSAGTSLAVVNKAALKSSTGGWALDGGTAQIEAELGDLSRWRHDPRTPAAWQISGKLAGKAELKHEQGITAGSIDGTIDQLEVVDAVRQAASSTSVAAWQEPHLVLRARGNYQHASEQVQIENVQIASAALRCDLSGTLPTSVRGGDVDLKGTIQYDWEMLAPLWQPYVGEGVWVAGQQTRAFAAHGRLSGEPTLGDSWRQVSGEAALGWAGMNVHGLAVSRADIAAQLADGQLRMQPIDVQVSEGRLTVAPVLRLNPAPPELLLARGPLLTDVHLSPELCARGLKFVAPILAESTVAEGSFSIALDGGRLPISDLGAGDVAGKMAMRGQAKPGPVAQEFLIFIRELTTILKRGVLANLADQSGALLAIDDSNIEFRMVNRRVYHRGLQFMVGAVPVTTHGSVGLDESLAIVAEIPLQATLLGIDLSLGTLEGQTLQIPLEGTLSRPKLDRRALQQLTGQMLQSTARGVLIEGVGKQLERLFPVQP